MAKEIKQSVTFRLAPSTAKAIEDFLTTSTIKTLSGFIREAVIEKLARVGDNP